MENKVLAQQFGLLIRRLRKERHLSQEEFAHRCGLHRTFVGFIERGERTITLETAYKLAQALNLSLSYIMACLEEQLGRSSGKTS